MCPQHLTPILFLCLQHLIMVLHLHILQFLQHPLLHLFPPTIAHL